MAKKTEKSSTTTGKYSPNIVNKKARFEYQLIEKFEAGIVLVGTEVKSLRQGKANLEEAYGRIRDDELYLMGCHIPIYEFGNLTNHEPLRSRKLLVHRRELKKIQGKLTQKGLTLVPLRIYFTRGLAKVELALAQGKSHGDKREKIKNRLVERDISRAMQKKFR
jgi:SsrA-binding protein